MMGFEDFPKPSGRDPKELLLTPEEVADVDFTDRYAYGTESEGQKVFVLGTKHTNKLDEVADFEELLGARDPDVVLTEVASPLVSYYPEMTLDEILAMRPEEIIQGQEQMYFTWRAMKEGKKVESWDIPQTEILKRTIHQGEENGSPRYTKGDALAWLATYGMRKLYEDGRMKVISATDDLFAELHKLILFACPGMEDVQDMSLEITRESLDAVLVATTNQSLADYVRRARNDDEYDTDQALVTRTSNSSFAEDMNAQRDRHAIEVIQKVKEGGAKSVLITAGGSHAIVWEKAIKQIYQPT